MIFYLVQRLCGKALSAFNADEDGVTALEYGLIAALVALIIIAGLSKLGGSLSAVFSKIASSV